MTFLAQMIAGSQQAFVPPVPAPVIEGSEIGSESSGTSVNATKPSGTVADDLLFFIHASDGSTTVLTPPTDAASLFDQSDANARVRTELSTKVAGGLEPASYTAVSGSSESQHLISILISGGNNASPLNVPVAVASGNNSTPVCPSVTTTKDNCLVLRIVVSDGDNLPVTMPVGTTGIQTAAINGVLGVTVAAAEEVQASAGATGIASFLQDSNQWMAMTVAIEPP